MGFCYLSTCFCIFIWNLLYLSFIFSLICILILSFSPKNISCKGGFFLFANGSAGILFPILRALVKSVENWSVQPSGSERHSLGFDSKMITMMILIMMIMMVNMKLLRVTKTRCQICGTIELHRGPISKVLRLVKMVFKHQMLSIFMAFKGISCKKRITQSRFAQFFYRYGIFWMLPGESSCPDGSEYVWQRGVESLQGQVTAAQSWPLFRPKKSPKAV